MVRTRMAPSPTGEFHIGGMRTLLYSYAIAKKHNGSFIIRIEDTDRSRIVEGSIQRIIDDVKAYGIDYDEGPGKDGEYGPYIQSERLEIYKKYVDQLLKSGDAYYCFCTKDRLSELRKRQQKEGKPPKYDKYCSKLSKNEIKDLMEKGKEYVVRLNVPEDQDITFHDEVYGDITFNSNSIDDQVLLKSDGFPTYHLAVVVDDHLMEISHVVRGNDWIPSTPKHVLLYKALRWEMPKHVHLPNLKEIQGNKKLSKRHGSVHARAFLEDGYLPEAILNFLMFLGWNPGTEREHYTLNEFVQDFDIKKIHPVDMVSFDRDKLLWMSGKYIRDLSLDELYNRVKEWANEYSQIPHFFQITEEEQKKLLSLIHERLKKFSEIGYLLEYFFETPELLEDLLVKFVNSKERASEILNEQLESIQNIEKWTSEQLHNNLMQLNEQKEFKNKEAFMTLRVALTGRKVSPQIFDVMEVLGKEESVSRVKSAIQFLSS